jgi:hypothetical protein
MAPLVIGVCTSRQPLKVPEQPPIARMRCPAPPAGHLACRGPIRPSPPRTKESRRRLAGANAGGRLRSLRALRGTSRDRSRPPARNKRSDPTETQSRRSHRRRDAFRRPTSPQRLNATLRVRHGTALGSPFAKCLAHCAPLPKEVIGLGEPRGRGRCRDQVPQVADDLVDRPRRVGMAERFASPIFGPLPQAPRVAGAALRRGASPRTSAATSRARRAASRSPSLAATIDPFMTICHLWARPPASATPASVASSSTNARILARWLALARRSSCFGSAISSSTLMNEQPSKSSRWNHSSKTSKIASRRSPDRRLAARLRAEASPGSSAARGARGTRARARPWSRSAGTGSSSRPRTGR